MKKFTQGDFQYFHVEEGVKSSCLIPMEGKDSCDLEVRSQKSVTVNVVTVDGEPFPVADGPIVRWNGRKMECSGVEIVSDTGFWYACRSATGWFERLDPTPAVVELVHTEKDALVAMIDEAVSRKWRQVNGNAPMSENEWEEMVLDLAEGNLDFDPEPDEFGLGYEERLKEFIAKQSESAEEEETAGPPIAEKPAGGESNSSST